MERPLAGLTRRNLAQEALAGVTLLAIAIPLNIGYAQIAGLPPTAGLDSSGRVVARGSGRGRVAAVSEVLTP